MTHWPSTIPPDLKRLLEASGSQEDWWIAFKLWLDRRGVQIDFAKTALLVRELAYLEEMRLTVTKQDEWCVIREWLKSSKFQVREQLQ